MDAVAYREVPLYAEQQPEPMERKMSFGAGHSRRFGSHFGLAGPAPAPIAIESRISHDSDGTWEFVTPPPVFEGTEAQRFAMMYRNGSLNSGSSGSTLAMVEVLRSNMAVLGVEIPSTAPSTRPRGATVDDDSKGLPRRTAVSARP